MYLSVLAFNVSAVAQRTKARAKCFRRVSCPGTGQ